MAKSFVGASKIPVSAIRVHASAASTLSTLKSLTKFRGSIIVTTQGKQAGISDVMKSALQSLPGITTFIDRAAVSMLK